MWHGEAEHPGGLGVDDQLELGRRLDRKVGRLRALKYAIDVAGRLPKLVDEIRPIRHQAAGSDEEPFPIDRRQLVPRRQRDDQIAMDDRQSACRQAAIPVARKFRYAPIDLICVAQVDRAQLYPERWRSGLDYGEMANSLG